MLSRDLVNDMEFNFCLVSLPLNFFNFKIKHKIIEVIFSKLLLFSISNTSLNFCSIVHKSYSLTDKQLLKLLGRTP
jgi:hypothetical protein